MNDSENSKDAPKKLTEALRELLMGGKAGSQEEICAALERKGFEINQSKASRLLRKIGARKVLNPEGQIVYSLPLEPAPPLMNTSLQSLILDVVSNETTVVVYTSPGSASMIARVLDYSRTNSEIMGTIAGDDTIFIIPKSIKQIKQMTAEIKTLLNM